MNADMRPHMSPEMELVVWLDVAIATARASVEESLALIERGEDGPATMRQALKTLHARLDVMDTEASILRAAIGELFGVAVRLREQRDEALSDRDQVIARVLQACDALWTSGERSVDPSRVAIYLTEALQAAGYLQQASTGAG